jgi:hypothetical protein
MATGENINKFHNRKNVNVSQPALFGQQELED